MAQKSGVISFNNSFQRFGDSGSYSMELKGRGRDEVLKWGLDGLLRADSASTYEWEKLTNGYHIERTFQSGGQEIYSWDRSKFKQVYATGGSKVVTRFINGSGEAFLQKGAILYYENGELKKKKQNYYAKGGGLLRTVIMEDGDSKIVRYNDHGGISQIKGAAKDLGATNNMNLKVENGRIIGIEVESKEVK